jgi:hypothetical protein
LCGIDQGSNGRVAAQLVQAAATAGADAPDGDAQLSADLVVWHRGVFDQEREQPLAVWRQVGEGLAQRGVAFGKQ